jgi:acetoin utilization protein AcuB
MSSPRIHLAAPPETLDSDPPLRHLMTHQLVGISLDADVHVAHALLSNTPVRHLPAMDGDRCRGLVFEHDVLGVLATQLPSGQVRPALVAQLYRRVPVLRPDDHRSTAAREMTATGLDAVLIITNEQLVGIVTATDILHSLAAPSPDTVRSGEAPR